ncbi:hypothetical protein [Synechococcus sp. CBW1006]|uniref:hypothetical protein n=1 Tax=Synechococcus sp. CBW1006 TaxID=1353138 RepID=UPI0018CCE9FA|nr:hypothetical protein [Synechococcus sp. CBW1006]QPN66567.1 hypothetical protein H8F26_17890 [Synechococcus sp. CBW1006]
MSKFVKAILFASAATLASVAMEASAIARPFLYMASFDYSGPYKQCVANAEKLLRSSGISRELEKKEYEESKSAVVFAFKDDDAITVEIQCIQKAGISLLGVAGLDNEGTWELFNELSAASW